MESDHSQSVEQMLRMVMHIKDLPIKDASILAYWLALFKNITLGFLSFVTTVGVSLFFSVTHEIVILTLSAIQKRIL